MGGKWQRAIHRHLKSGDTGHRSLIDSGLSQQVMHDEVSETENIRKNLAIERMIIEGCDILLDVNQTFVRQGQSDCVGQTYCVH